MRTTAGAATDAIEEAKNVRRAMRIEGVSWRDGGSI
jgi:hypothetical protein